MKKKILVVDNHPVMLEFMTNLLEKKGHQVLTAENGLSALGILKTCIPDVIFIDLVMPHISGEKLCRIIRSMPKLKNVYLIVLSAIAAEETTNFAEFGANACIAKGPFNEMAGHVLAALGQSDLEASSVFSEEIIGVQDISERQITMELLSSQRHSEVILGNMSEGILELNLEGMIISVNPAAVLLTGIPEIGLLASNFTELFHGTHRKRITDLLAKIADTPETINEDSPLTLNSKQVSLNILPIKNEEYKSIVVILDDITERKRAREALKEDSKRLEEMVKQRTKDLQEAQEQLVHREKLAVLGQLAGGVSHELRNPIGAIKNAAYFLKMAIENGEPDVMEALEILEKEVNTSNGIISSLLDYARPKSANRLKVDVNDVVRDALSRRPVPDKIEVVSQLDETLSTIIADPNQLSQVFRNLICNAIQAMPEGGRLVVKTSASYIRPVFDPECSDRRELMSKAVEPSEAPSPEWVTVSFTDTGTGIDEETLAKVFEPLFTTKARGIGLGLALTKLLIEGHGGIIEAQSTVGKGSTFSVKLPVSIT